MDETDRVYIATKTEGGVMSEAIITYWGETEGGENGIKGRISSVLRVSRRDVCGITRNNIPRHLKNQPMSVTDGVTHSGWVGKPGQKAARAPFDRATV